MSAIFLDLKIKREETALCDFCGYHPCDPRCPNSEGPREMMVCSGCGDRVHEGEEYWEIMGECLCASCMEESRRIAERAD